MASSVTYTIPSGLTAVIDYPSVSVAHAPIISAQGHFTSVIRYNIQVRGYVTVASGGQSLANKIVDYRNILSTPGGNLSVNIGDYAKTFLAAESSNLGPHPTAFEVLEMPGGKIARVTWQLAIEVIGNRKATNENWWTEFAYTIETSVNVNLLTTRMISGILRINPRAAALNQGLTHASADACRKAVEANVCACPDPAYWERQWTFKLSEDEIQLWFTCVDTERYMPLPKNVTSGDFSITLSANWLEWHMAVELQCSYFGSLATYACKELERKISEWLVEQTGEQDEQRFSFYIVDQIRSQISLSEGGFKADARAEWIMYLRPGKAKRGAPTEVGWNAQEVFTGWMDDNWKIHDTLRQKSIDFFNSMNVQYKNEKKEETWKTGDFALTGGWGVGRCSSEKLLQQLLITIPDKFPPEKPPDSGEPGDKPDPGLPSNQGEKSEPTFYLSWHEHFAYKIDWGYKFIPTIGGVDVTQQWHKPTVWLITTGEMTTMEIMPRPKPPAYQYGSAERKDKTVTKAYLVNAEFALNEPTRDGHWNSSWRYIVKLEVDSIPKNWEVLFPDSPFFEFEEPPVFALPELTNETQE